MDHLYYILFMSCVGHAFASGRFCMWSPAGKGLTSWLLYVMFNCVFVSFPCGILGQVWYLHVIVSILDLCRLKIDIVLGLNTPLLDQKWPVLGMFYQGF